MWFLKNIARIWWTDGETNDSHKKKQLWKTTNWLEEFDVDNSVRGGGGEVKYFMQLTWKLYAIYGKLDKKNNKKQGRTEIFLDGLVAWCNRDMNSDLSRDSGDCLRWHPWTSMSIIMAHDDDDEVGIHQKNHLLWGTVQDMGAMVEHIGNIVTHPYKKLPLLARSNIYLNLQLWDISKKLINKIILIWHNITCLNR